MAERWNEVFSDEERLVYETYQRGQGGQVQPYGLRPALIVIDVTLAFCGRQGQSLQEATAEWPTACGPYAWDAIPHIQSLLQAAREAAIPVVYTTAQPGAERFYGHVVKRKPEVTLSTMSRPGATDIPAEIAPRDGELLLQKPKASAFFATPLFSHLHRMGVDSLIVSGATTSGCVRASVVDSFSWGLPTFVVEEAVFDRSRLSHAVNLFEMNAKYADVIGLEDALGWLASVAASHAPREAGALVAGGEA